MHATVGGGRAVLRVSPLQQFGRGAADQLFTSVPCLFLGFAADDLQAHAEADLVLAAVNEAQSRATALYEEEMRKLSGGLSLPFNIPGL